MFHSVIFFVTLTLSQVLSTTNAWYGVDLATPFTVDNFKCMNQELNVTFAVVRCYRSIGAPDANCPQSIANAWNAGYRGVDAYFFPCFSCDMNATAQMEEFWQFINMQKVYFTNLWLDIEGPGQFWSPTNQRANVEFIQDLIDGALRYRSRYNIGIYTSHNSWPNITGDSTAFSDYMLWYPHWESPPNPSFSDWGGTESLFGNWSQPTMKQYDDHLLPAGSCDGIDADVDWYPG